MRQSYVGPLLFVLVAKMEPENDLQHTQAHENAEQNFYSGPHLRLS